MIYLYVKVQLLSGERWSFRLPKDINQMMLDEYLINKQYVVGMLKGALINVPLSLYENGEATLGVGKILNVYTSENKRCWCTRGQFIVKDRYQTLPDLMGIMNFMAHDHSQENQIRIKRDLYDWYEFEKCKIYTNRITP